MKPIPVSLARALPKADGAAARLRRCAAALRGLGRGRPVCGTAFHIETGAEAQTTADHLQLTVRSAFGSLEIAMSCLQWPAMDCAATLADRRSRDAVATLLLREGLGPLGHLLLSVELLPAPAPVTRTSGVVCVYRAARLEVLRADTSLLGAIGGTVADADRTVGMPYQTTLRLPSRLWIGRRLLSRTLLQGLRALDVVLLPANAGGAARSTLTWGDGTRRLLRAGVLLQASTMTLIEAPHLSSDADISAESQDAPAPGATATARALARLELPVDFELDGPQLSLADIATLDAGDVLELPSSIDHAQVRITVARQRVGLGELVAVGGRLGVRILAMDIAPDRSPGQELGA